MRRVLYFFNEHDFVPTLPSSFVQTLNNNGSDWGARINAADAFLGAAPGIIEIFGGGVFGTPAIIGVGPRVLFIGPGIYQNNVSGTAFQIYSGSSVVGAGMAGTLVYESSIPGQFATFAGYNNIQSNYSSQHDIYISDLQIIGQNPQFGSVAPTISLGNCIRGSIKRIYLNSTKSIGLQIGGGSSKGNFADACEISECICYAVASQNLAITNAKNCFIRHNILRDPAQVGGSGATVIDMEPNVGDIIDNVSISDNIIDCRGSPSGTVSNGININCTNITNYSTTIFNGPIVVLNNVILGGEIYVNTTNLMANGIYIINSRDVEVSNNHIIRTGQEGFNAAGGLRLLVSNNKLLDVGGGGNNGFQITDTTYSRFIGNVVDQESGVAVNTIVETGSSNYNIYLNNISGGITTVGANDIVNGNINVGLIG